jgi:hypothetical protein
MDKKNSFQHPRAPISMLIYSFLEYFAPLAGMVILVAMGGYFDKRRNKWVNCKQAYGYIWKFEFTS